MKEITLGQVRKGERFVLDGVAFIKLDEDREASFVLAENVVLQDIAFDTRDREDSNNFDGSEVHGALKDWVAERGIISQAMRERPIDLLSMDGMDDYGNPEVEVRILTVDEYRKYRSIIPLTDKAYWLATPWTTLRSPLSDSAYAYYVNASGALYLDYVRGPGFAARPAFYLQSSISVSLEEELKITFEEESNNQGGLETYTTTQLLAEVGRRLDR